ncbi:MAG TPA: hypothetical protein VI248_13815 [Kineosporiaceae bacterium]
MNVGWCGRAQPWSSTDASAGFPRWPGALTPDQGCTHRSGRGAPPHAARVADRYDAGLDAAEPHSATAGDPSGTSTSAPTVRFVVNPGTAQVASLSLPDLRQSVDEAVDAALGVASGTVANLTAAGGSLSEIAISSGSTRDDVIAAIRQGLPGTLQTSAAGRALARRIADTHGPIDADTLKLPVTTGGGAATQTIDLTLTSVRTLLGIGSRDLRAKLADGISLTALADARGIGHDDLITAIEKDLPAETPGWSDVSTLAAQIADGTEGQPVGDTPPTWPVAGPGSSGSRTPVQRFTVNPGVAQVAALTADDVEASVLTALTGRLGLDADEVGAELDGGATLNAVAHVAGVSHDDLINAVRTALPGTASTSSVGTALAEQIARTPGRLTDAALRLPTGAGGADARQSFDTSLATVATLLGTRPDRLMHQLSRGASLDDLAENNGIAHDDLVAAIETDLPDETVGWADVSALAEQIAAATDSVPVSRRPDPWSARVHRSYGLEGHGWSPTGAWDW